MYLGNKIARLGNMLDDIHQGNHIEIFRWKRSLIEGPCVNRAARTLLCVLSCELGGFHPRRLPAHRSGFLKHKAQCATHIQVPRARRDREILLNDSYMCASFRKTVLAI
jgi:hypothetical protein